MNKPFVVCHMLASLDGKIDGDFFGAPETLPALSAYGSLRGHYMPEATVYGATTMLGGYADRQAPKFSQTTKIQYAEDYISPEGVKTANFIVSLDPNGTLGFSSHIIRKSGRAPAHVIQVLTSQVSAEYLTYLREKGISYLFAGEKTISCKLLLDKLAQHFRISRVMVAGGGITNWSFLREGLIDELSLVLAPVADGGHAASTFEQGRFFSGGNPAAFRLLEVKQLDGNALWLRYGS